MRHWPGLLLMIPLAISSCAKHAPEPTPHPSTPHITWSVAEGYTDNEVCKSTEKTPCVLTVSDKEPNRRLGVFHVFLHSATTDTKYEGTVAVRFLGGAERDHVQKVDRIVPRGSDPVNVSSTGIVRPPGTYYVDVALTAAPAKGSGSPLPLKERIRVDIK